MSGLDFIGHALDLWGGLVVLVILLAIGYTGYEGWLKPWYVQRLTRPVPLPVPAWSQQPAEAERFRRLVNRGVAVMTQADQEERTRSRRTSQEEAGEKFEQFVGRELAYLHPQGYRHLHGVRIPGVVRSEIDQVVIGPNGIVCVEAKWRYGTVHVDQDQWTFTSYNTNQTRGMENPIYQNARHIADLRHFLQERFGAAGDQVTLHNVVCLSAETVLEGAWRGTEVVKVDGLTRRIQALEGRNPFGPSQYEEVLEAMRQATRQIEIREKPWLYFDPWALTARDYPEGALVPVVVADAQRDRLLVRSPWGLSAVITGAEAFPGRAEPFRKVAAAEILLAKVARLDPGRRELSLAFPTLQEMATGQGDAEQRQRAPGC